MSDTATSAKPTSAVAVRGGGSPGLRRQPAKPSGDTGLTIPDKREPTKSLTKILNSAIIKIVARYCKNCGNLLPSNRWAYCSDECKKAFSAKKYREQNPLKGPTTATTGAISELRVAADLLAKGYNVFRALSPSCPCDLLILKDDKALIKLIRVEVTTANISSTGKMYKRKKPDGSADVLAYVLPSKIIYDPDLF